MFNIGDVVIIRNDKYHDGQFGIICHTTTIGNNLYYSVHTWEPTADRFWCIGAYGDKVSDDEPYLEYQGYSIIPMLESWQHWMNSQYCRKTGLKIKPHKFGQLYDYWKKRKEKGEEKAKR